MRYVDKYGYVSWYWCTCYVQTADISGLKGKFSTTESLD